MVVHPQQTNGAGRRTVETLETKTVIRTYKKKKMEAEMKHGRKGAREKEARVLLKLGV